MQQKHIITNRKTVKCPIISLSSAEGSADLKVISDLTSL